MCNNDFDESKVWPFPAARAGCRLLLLCLAIYTSLIAGCASWQRHKIYLAHHFDTAEVDKRAKAAGLERWYNSAGQPIGMKRLSPVQPAASRLLILYGNASWTVSCAHYVNDIQKVAPLDVYIVEYPGYADRAGSPSEKTVFHAADEALELLATTNQPLYLLGESLGSGVASHLAGKYPDKVAGILLLSPFNSLTGVAQHQVPYLPAWLILLDRFRSGDYLRHYHGPVGITIDGKDQIVPEKFGLKLYDGYAGPKELWNFPNGHHIAIGESPTEFWREVLEFWQANQSIAQ